MENSKKAELLNRRLEKLLNELGDDHKDKSDLDALVLEIKGAEAALKDQRLIEKIDLVNNLNSNLRAIQKDIIKLGDIPLDLFTDSMQLHKTKVKKRKDILKFKSKYNHVYFSSGYDGRLIINVNRYKFYTKSISYDNGIQKTELLTDYEKALKTNDILFKNLSINKVKNDIKKIISSGEKIKKAAEEYDKKIETFNKTYYETENFISRSDNRLYTYFSSFQ